MAHRLLHDSLALSTTFLIAVVVTAIFAVAAGLLASHYKRLSARSRYLILAFALIVPPLAATVSASGVAKLFDGASEAAGSAVPGRIDLQPQTSGVQANELPCVLFGIWVAGVLVFAFLSVRRSVKWSRIALAATATSEASAVGACAVAVSPAAAEPMVVGLFRPVILLPEFFADTLDELELASVFAHELEHVRRRDNLSAAMHELLAALFWFDPVHWIARRRSLELRERACDERVLELGGSVRPYISALSKTCHAAIESPAVACMSGFHIQERIESIMNYSSDRARFLSHKLIRIALIVSAIVVITSFAAITPPPLLAEAAKDKKATPISLSLKDANLHDVLRTFGQLTGRRIVADPGVNGKITIDLKDVPWDEALLKAIAPLGLAAVMNESEIRVFRPEEKYRRLDETIKRPELVTRVEPQYTEEARKAGVSGIVIVEAQIDETGVVRATKVVRDLEPGLGEAAARAIRQWMFTPALLDGKPVPVVLSITVNFRLDGKGPEKK